MVEYNPACYRCRLEAKRPIANVKEQHLCLEHMHDRIEELEAELDRLYKFIHSNKPLMKGE